MYILLFLVLSSAAALAVTSAAFWKGFIKARRTIAGTAPSRSAVTVLVAARNEERRLPALLAALEHQDYPPELLSFIIVDDRSTDGTARILEAFSPPAKTVTILRIDEIEPGISGKKNALAKAIEQADTDILLFTDADCVPGPQWVRRMTDAMHNADAVLGASPVKPENGSFVERYIAYETARTMFFMHGANGLGRPYMSLGRNWVYRKSLFLRCGGFTGMMDIPGGDDDLLLQRFAASGARIVSCLTPDSWTDTGAPASFGDMFRQKRRHYGAAKRYASAPKFFLGGIQILEWVCIICSGIGIFALPFPAGCLPAGMLLLIACVQMSIIQKEKTLLRISAASAPLWEAFHLFFSTVSGVAGLFRSSSW